MRCALFTPLSLYPFHLSIPLSLSLSFPLFPSLSLSFPLFPSLSLSFPLSPSLSFSPSPSFSLLSLPPSISFLYLSFSLFSLSFSLTYLMDVFVLVFRDIGGSDPERMAAPRVEEYVRESFKNSCIQVKVKNTACGQN